MTSYGFSPMNGGGTNGGATFVSFGGDPNGGGTNGRGRFGGGRGNRGRGGGRGRFQPSSNNSRNNNNNNDNNSGTAAAKQICNFYIRGNCTNGATCRFSHDISILSTISSLGAPVKSISMAPNGNIYVGVGKSIQMYSPSGSTITFSGSMDLGGTIHHIETIDNFLIVSTDSLIPQYPKAEVGIVSILNPDTNQSFPLIRSQSLPFTHPQTIRTFIANKFDADIYIVTAGLEGMIHVWCFSPSNSSVNHMFGLEGHVREVTSLVLQGNCLWSGSIDCTINCWDLGSREVNHSIRAIENNGSPDNSTLSGHETPITCMAIVSCSDGEFMVTSSLDNLFMVWNGVEKVYQQTEQDIISAMAVTTDTTGEPILLFGLRNGNVVIRRWPSLDSFIMLDKAGLKHNGPVWSIVPLQPGLIATGGDDGQVNIWRIDSQLFN